MAHPVDRLRCLSSWFWGALVARHFSQYGIGGDEAVAQSDDEGRTRSPLRVAFSGHRL